MLLYVTGGLAYGGVKSSTAIGQVAQRYARALNIGARDLGDALQEAHEALRKGVPLPTPRRGDTPAGDLNDATLANQ